MDTYTLFIILSVVAILIFLGVLEQINGTGMVRRVLYRHYHDRHYHHHDYDRMSFNDDEYFS